MTFDSLLYFISIAECGSMVSAAKAIHISPQGLSKSIQLLEAELNMPLFHRTNKGILLTDFGKYFYKEAKHIADSMIDLNKCPENFLRITEKTLRIGIPVELAKDDVNISDLCTDFRQAVTDPEVEIELSSSPDFMNNLQRVETGDLDTALAVLPADSDIFHVFPLCSREFVSLVCTDHPLAQKEFISIHDLEKERIIISMGDHFITKKLRETLSPQIIDYNLLFVSMYSTDLLTQLIQSNTCVSILSRTLAENLALQTPSVKQIPFSPALICDLGFVTSKKSSEKIVLQQFTDFLSSYSFSNRTE